MLYKKGELEINQVVLFLLALIVLVTLVYIFRTQIASFLATLTGIETGITQKTPPIEQIIGS